MTGGRPSSTLAELSRKPTTRLRDVGPAKARALATMGIETVLDLLCHYPRRYQDRSHPVPIGTAEEGEEALVIGQVEASDLRRISRGRNRVEVRIRDDTAALHITFFNQDWRARQLRAGMWLAAFGRLELYRGRRSMVNPVLDVVSSDEDEDPSRQTGRVVAIYPQSGKAGLGSVALSKMVVSALETAGTLEDPVPADQLERLGLIDRTSAFAGIHCPAEFGLQFPSRRRLAFDELFRLQLELVLRKRADQASARGIAHASLPSQGVSPGLVNDFVHRLPFPLTGAQRRAIREIAADLQAQHPMHRLLQGDVGAGKTVVALATLLYAVQGGHQGALMAPTEVLAEQHYAGALQLLRDLPVTDPSRLGGRRPLAVALLTNKTTPAERSRMQRELAGGEVDILVGTHALLGEDVRFRSLGAVVIDEQHRFGVEQRAALRAKGEHDPDVLVMTATPIPRTAAMMVYGDLDLTVLDEMPAGRLPVQTLWCRGSDAEATAWNRVRSEVRAGHQAFVVCPLVNASDAAEDAAQAAQASGEAAEVLAGGAVDEDGQGILFEAASLGARTAPRGAVEERARLTSDGGELAGLAVGLLHGQMPPREKEAVMEAFRRGDLDVLVATTVVEVGVDVANATVMVVEDADRFGIAQLHQLRGRVGRGGEPAWCYLLAGEVSPEGEQRLRAMERSNDGFELAEEDLALRGEGTVLGARQKGRSDLKLASLRRGGDRDLVMEARAVAEAVLDSDPGLGHHLELVEELRAFIDEEEAEFLFKS